MIHMKKAIKNLEFDKILNILKTKVVCEINIEKVLNIKPFDTVEKVNKSLNHTEYFCKKIMENGNPPNIFVRDIKDILKYIEKEGILEVSDIFKINKFLILINEFKEWLQLEKDHNSDEELIYIIDSLDDVSEVRELVKRVFLDEYTVNDDATDNLKNIRWNIKNSKVRLREICENIVKNKKIQKYLMEQTVTIRENRFVIPVKAEFKNNVKGLIHSTSSSGSTVFIEPIEIVEVNNKIKLLIEDEKREVYEIIKKISEIIRKNKVTIKRVYDDFLEIDISLAKAKFSVDCDCTKPNINTNKYINIKKAKHPLIKKEDVVPIDVEIGNDYSVIVITGPNTGGKTVVLKTVGLVTLMALSGMYVPTNSGSDISFFDKIYTDIGDMQSIEHNLSTFSSHMTNIIDILEDIDENKNTLTLLDELGSGTDPTEGASLAIGIIDYLKNKKTVLMTSTHYSEVKMYAINEPFIENGSCHFDIETLSPTYKFLIGVPGSSNAFSISKKLGLKDSIIDFSNTFLENEKLKIEKTIKNLEESKLLVENEKLEVENLKEQVKKELKRQEDLRVSLEVDFKNQKKINREKAEYLLEKVTIEANRVFEEIEKQKKEVNKTKNYKNINNLRKKVYGQIDEISKNLSKTKQKQKTDVNINDIKKGNTVHLVDIDKEATIISDLDKNGMVEVNVGILKTKTHISNISSIKKGNVTFNGGNITKKLNKNDGGKSTIEIDVRGLNVFESTMEIDKFIDIALIRNLDSFIIVHGKGTGALRKGIHSYLKKHKYVKEYRLGTFGEGEDGVTIVNIK